MKDILAIFGAGTIIGFLFVLIALFFQWATEQIRRFRYRQMIKHRFDKPPTAKCYCKDCIKHGEDGRCYKFNEKWTAENSFCWDAEPRKKGAL